MKIHFPIALCVVELATSNAATFKLRTNLGDSHSDGSDGWWGDADDCKPSWDLRDAVEAGATNPDAICEGGWFGFDYAYKCDAESGPGYACCDEDDATLSPGHILGTCTKMTSDADENLKGKESDGNSEDEEEDEDEDEEGWFDDADDCIPSWDLRDAVAAGVTNPDQICADGVKAWLGYTNAYQCDADNGPGYACCDENDPTLTPGHILGSCTKMTSSLEDQTEEVQEEGGDSNSEDEDEDEEGWFDDADDCFPSWDLKGAVEAGVTDPDQICEDGVKAWLGYTNAYKCDGENGPGYACCDENDPTLTPGHILGTCTKMTSYDETMNRVNLEESVSCIPTGALAPVARGPLSPSEVCERDYWWGTMTTPYQCTLGARYACCEGNAGSISPGMGLGSCTKIDGAFEKENEQVQDQEDGSNSEDEDEGEDWDADDCFPSWDLKDAVAAGVTNPDQICADGVKGWLGYTNAYKCDGDNGPGYACCDEDDPTLTPGHILGTCTKMTSARHVPDKNTQTTFKLRINSN